jgi:hypothetical protein
VQRFKNRYPSPAMAVAFVALVAALSGTAVALPGKNSVDSGDLKKGAVRGPDIGANAVTGKKVKGSSLTGSDVRANSLTGGDINEGSLAQVPSANAANTANSANNANSANRANSAGSVDQIDPSEPSFLTEGGSRVILQRGPITVTHLCNDPDADNIGDGVLQITTTEGAPVLGQVSSLGVNGTTLIPFAPGIPANLAIGEGSFGGSGVLTGPNGNTLFNVIFQIAGENTASFYNTTSECEASISVVE